MNLEHKMKLNYLKLKNIGPFIGEHTIELTTNRTHNIILIGGKNGSGKTTLLKSVKYGLFGSYSFGYKNTNKSYFDEIGQFISINRTDQDCYVEICFSLVEQYKQSNVIIKRNWKIDGNSIEEKVLVILNKKELNHEAAKSYM